MAMHSALCSSERAMMWTNRRASLASAVVGALVWVPLIATNRALGHPGNEAWTLWYWLGYPALLAFLFGIGTRLKVYSWSRGLIAVFSSYLTALLLVAHTGGLLPFEILAMGVLSVPAILAERMGAKFGAQARGDSSVLTNNLPRDPSG